METVNAPQHRPVRRRNFKTSPDCVNVDAGRKSDHLHQLNQPANRVTLVSLLFTPSPKLGLNLPTVG